MRVLYVLAIVLALIYILIFNNKDADTYSKASYKKSYQEVSLNEDRYNKELLENFKRADQNWQLNKEIKKKKPKKVEKKKELKKSKRYKMTNGKSLCEESLCIDFVALLKEGESQFALFYIQNEDDKKVFFKKVKSKDLINNNLKLIELNEKKVVVLSVKENEKFVFDTGFVDQSKYEKNKRKEIEN